MLNSYKRRTIRERMVREAKSRTETRDAILWSIDITARVAQVKIQGSDTLIQAWLPENWEQTPEWAKPGNSVKIMHTAGDRNIIELVGHGLSVPTPITSVPAAPTIASGMDAIMSGMNVLATVDNGMSIYITPGTYRINGFLYYADPILMLVDSDITMSSTGPYAMGNVWASVDIDAADSTLFRIDIFSVGTDGVLTYTTGTPAASSPVRPTTPTGHVLIGWVLVTPGATGITQDLINSNLVGVVPSLLLLNPTYTYMTWVTQSVDITVSVLDQYRNGLTTQPWTIYGTMLSGSGTITYSKTMALGEYSTVMTYTREVGYDDPITPVAEDAPVYVQFSLAQALTLKTAISITLLDSGSGVIV